MKLIKGRTKIMAYKVKVRRSIRKQLGLETAKEFDKLYSMIKRSCGDIVLIEEGHHLLDGYMKEDDESTGGRGWVGFRCDDPSKLMEIFRSEVERLRENALKSRVENPDMYDRHPHLDDHLFVE